MDDAARPARGGWPLVLAYAGVAGSSQLLWLTYAPITTASARHYDVSVTAIGWLANVFPLLYVVLAVPAGLALDRRPTTALTAGAVLTAAGGVVRLGGDSFGWALTGQVLVAVAQPFVLNAITGVVAVLPERSRPTGIAVGSGGLFLGLVAALGAGSLAGGQHLSGLLRWQAVAGVVVVAAFLVVRRGAPAPVAFESTEPGDLRAVWTDPVLRRIALLAFLGFGVFIALTTWLQALLEPQGVTESAAGWIITAAVAVGAVGSVVVAAALEGRGVEVPLLRVLLLLAVAGCAVLAVANGVPLATAGAVLATFALLTALPWLLALCERRAVDPAAGGTRVASATALLWLAGNLGGLVIAVAVGGLVDHPVPAFLLLCAVALLGLPFVRADRLGVAR